MRRMPSSSLGTSVVAGAVACGTVSTATGRRHRRRRTPRPARVRRRRPAPGRTPEHDTGRRGQGGAGADPVAFTDAVRGHRPAGQADRRPLARRSRAVPCAVRRHRRAAAWAVRRRRVADRQAAPPGGRHPRRGRRVRAPGAGTAERRRRHPRPRRPAGRHRRGRLGAVVPDVGRRPQARPCRALARRAAGAQLGRPGHGDVAAQRPHARRRRRARRPAGDGGAGAVPPSTGAGGSMRCARGSSSVERLPATSPTSSSPT